MARITVEDCVKKVSNRFELVVLAAERVRQIMGGDSVLLKREGDKNPVIALREIASGLVDPKALTENIIRGHQKSSAPEEENEENVLEFMSQEQDWVENSSSTDMQEEIEEEDLSLVEDLPLDDDGVN